MDNQERNTASEGKATSTGPIEAGTTPANPSRRRFARLGAGASGMILTFSSQAGVLGPVVCTAASAGLSAGTIASRTPHASPAVVCAGLSPGYWKQSQHTWPIINNSVTPVSMPNLAGGLSEAKSNGNGNGGGGGNFTDLTQRNTPFSSVFPGGGTTLYQTGTMQQVLESNDNSQDPYNLGMHMVAAYLNVMSHNISFLTATGLQGMWYDIVTYGTYKPTAGVSWTAEQLKNYLESTEH